MMPDVPVSAVPVALDRFEDRSSAGAASVLAVVGGAAGDLARATGQPWGVGAAAAAGLAIVAGSVPAHAGRVAGLGEAVGAVGAAFAAVGRGVVLSPVRWAEPATLAEWVLDQVHDGGLDIPDQWATLVPGLGGCPAVALPVWALDGSDDTGVRSLTEPLTAPAPLLCEPEAEAATSARVETRVWVPGEVVVGPGGTVTMLPGAWIGTTSEVRGRGRRPRPTGQDGQQASPSVAPLSPIGPERSIHDALDDGEDILELPSALDVPVTATPGAVAVVRNQSGEITTYTAYGSDGWPVTRVDVQGRAHGDLPTPHAVDYTRTDRRPGVRQSVGPRQGGAPMGAPGCWRLRGARVRIDR